MNEVQDKKWCGEYNYNFARFSMVCDIFIKIKCSPLFPSTPEP